MRRRGTGPGVRAQLAAEYRRFADLYGHTDERIGRSADAIEAGEAVVVRAYEVDLLPPNDMVRVEPDGSLHRVTWDRESRVYVDLEQRDDR